MNLFKLVKLLDVSLVAELFGLVLLFIGLALISIAVALIVVGALILFYGLFIDLTAAKNQVQAN